MTMRYETLVAILADLKDRGIEFRFIGDSMQYRDPYCCLTDGQHALIDRLRPELYEQLRLEQVSADLPCTSLEILRGDKPEDHQPEDVIRGCWGLYRTCQKERLPEPCSDCSLFAAQAKLDKLRAKREKKEEKQRQVHERRRLYFNQEEGEVVDWSEPAQEDES
jgi:hypothetical protein